MSKWECQRHGCTNSAVGTGGAVGLRAIGWYFELGPVIFCPAHRPDGTTERTPLHDPDDTTDRPCPHCKADMEAARYQALMGTRILHGDEED